MEYKIKSLSDANPKGKKVFIRLDFDVPIKNGEIKDDSRLISGFESVKYLIEKGAIVIAAGHIGRPDGIEEKLSTKIVAKWFQKKLLTSKVSETEVEGFKAWRVSPKLIVLENLRFDKGEEENNDDFSKNLASTAQIYVNEAFGVSHRKHASVYGITKHLPGFAGYHLMREVKILSKALEKPKRPLTFIIGGAKIETKLPLISKMHSLSDFVLVGGELAEQTKILAKEQHAQIAGQKAMLLVADLTQNTFDITLNSVKNFEQVIEKSETIVWNGPMGFIEEGYTEATLELAKIIDNKKAHKIIGGGDTIGYLSDKNLLNNYDLVSMGGGAMLEFLSGEKLPGIEALED